jgi:hypothetical protein
MEHYTKIKAEEHNNRPQKAGENMHRALRDRRSTLQEEDGSNYKKIGDMVDSFPRHTNNEDETEVGYNSDD